MNSVERRHKILERLEKDEFVNVSALCTEFNVSDVTIRSDLKKLEETGFVKRIHGGASKLTLHEYYPSIHTMSTKNISKKKEIGKEAKKYISDGDVIMIDSSSTCYELAACIKNSELKDIVVITNSFRTHMLLMDANNVELIFLGGKTNKKMECTNGNMTLKMIENLFADKVFLGTNGVDLSVGVTACNFEENDIKKAMKTNSKESFLLVDSSKFNQTNIAVVDKINGFDFIITDTDVPHEYIDSLGSQLIIAKAMY
jgi:DeoR/GlpR family transcriptional regulator of sugar metabolism